MEICFTQLWGMTIFEHKHSQSSEVVHLRCGGILLCQKFTAKSAAGKILKSVNIWQCSRQK